MFGIKIGKKIGNLTFKMRIPNHVVAILDWVFVLINKDTMIPCRRVSE